MPDIANLFQARGKRLAVDLGDNVVLHITYARERTPIGWDPLIEDETARAAATLAFLRAVLTSWDLTRDGTVLDFDDPTVPAGVFQPIYEAIVGDLLPDPTGAGSSPATSSTNGTAPAAAPPSSIANTSSRTARAAGSSKRRSSGR